MPVLRPRRASVTTASAFARHVWCSATCSRPGRRERGRTLRRAEEGLHTSREPGGVAGLVELSADSRPNAIVRQLCQELRRDARVGGEIRLAADVARDPERLVDDGELRVSVEYPLQGVVPERGQPTTKT
jgi:hypothetical protein